MHPTPCLRGAPNPGRSDSAFATFSSTWVWYAQRLPHLLLLFVTVCAATPCMATIAPVPPRPPPLHIQSILPYERLRPRDMALRRRRGQATFERNLTALLTVLVTNYTAYHRALRSRCEADPALARRTRLLVYRGNPHYGLGDRVRGALHAYMMAVATGRLLLLDQTEPFAFHSAWASSSRTNFTHDSTRFPAPCGHVPRPATPDVIFDARFRHTSQYHVPQRVLVVVRMPGFAPRDVLAHLTAFPALRNALQRAGVDEFSPRRDELAPFLMQALYRPTLRLRALLRDARPFFTPATKFSGAEGRPYLTVHARLGAGLGELSGPRFNYSAHGLTLHSVARCLGRVGGRAAMARGARRVLVVTDTREMQPEIAAGLRETLSYGTVSFARGRVAHIGRMVTDGARDRDAFDAFMRAFVDVGLVGFASSVVHVRSGFVDVGTWVGATADRQVVNVRSCKKELGKGAVW